MCVWGGGFFKLWLLIFCKINIINDALMVNIGPEHLTVLWLLNVRCHNWTKHTVYNTLYSFLWHRIIMQVRHHHLVKDDLCFQMNLQYCSSKFCILHCKVLITPVPPLSFDFYPLHFKVEVPDHLLICKRAASISVKQQASVSLEITEGVDGVNFNTTGKR